MRIHRLGLVVLAAALAWFFFLRADFSATQEKDLPAQKAPPPKRFPVHIRTPDGPPGVKTAHADGSGQPAAVRCATCHALLTPNREARSGEQLTAFHQGLRFKHGQLTCLSCHHAEDYDSLRAADNRKIPFARVMDLCGQCHGPQARDYEHGAHGGMTGFWDLTRGPRRRNNCIDCHDPHHPAYPRVRPVFAPKDRFPPGGGHDAKEKVQPEEGAQR